MPFVTFCNIVIIYDELAQCPTLQAGGPSLVSCPRLQLLQFSPYGLCCEKLVAEAREQFGNPEEGKRPPLEAATKQWPVKTQQIEET
jgi:hypothetical protein